MISEMLKLENIQIIESAKDWKEAIHLSLEQLVNGGYVTENYEAAIIKCTEEYGIALGASDANSHIDVMKVLSLLLMDESKIKELVEATSEQQIYEMLTKAESNL